MGLLGPLFSPVGVAMLIMPLILALLFRAGKSR